MEGIWIWGLQEFLKLKLTLRVERQVDVRVRYSPLSFWSWGVVDWEMCGWSMAVGVHGPSVSGPRCWVERDWELKADDGLGLWSRLKWGWSREEFYEPASQVCSAGEAGEGDSPWGREKEYVQLAGTLRNSGSINTTIQEHYLQVPMDVSLTETSPFGRGVWFWVSRVLSWVWEGTGEEIQKHGEDTQHFRAYQGGLQARKSTHRRCVLGGGTHSKEKMATAQPLSDWKLFSMPAMCLVYFLAQPSFTQDWNTSSSLSLSSLHTKTIPMDSFTLCHLWSSREHPQPITSSHSQPLQLCSPQLQSFCNEVVRRPWEGSSDLGGAPRLGVRSGLLKVQASSKFPCTLDDFSGYNVVLLDHILIL